MDKEVLIHLNESIKQINDLADKILLNDKDLEIDERFLAPLQQKLENVIISDHLTDLANKRILEANDKFGEYNVPDTYSERLTDLLIEIIREKS